MAVVRQSSMISSTRSTFSHVKHIGGLILMTLSAGPSTERITLRIRILKMDRSLDYTIELCAKNILDDYLKAKKYSRLQQTSRRLWGQGISRMQKPWTESNKCPLHVQSHQSWPDRTLSVSRFSLKTGHGEKRDDWRRNGNEPVSSTGKTLTPELWDEPSARPESVFPGLTQFRCPGIILCL